MDFVLVIWWDLFYKDVFLKFDEVLGKVIWILVRNIMMFLLYLVGELIF